MIKFRSRWHNYLSPEIDKDPITAREELLIFEGIKKHGSKWVEIARCLKGRTENAIKNYFYAVLRKQLRKIMSHVKNKKPADYKELSIETLRNIIKTNGISYEELDNQHVKDLLLHLDQKDNPIPQYSLHIQTNRAKPKPEEKGILSESQLKQVTKKVIFRGQKTKEQLIKEYESIRKYYEEVNRKINDNRSPSGIKDSLVMEGTPERIDLIDSMCIGTPQFRVPDNSTPQNNLQGEDLKELIKLRREFSFGVDSHIDILASVEKSRAEMLQLEKDNNGSFDINEGKGSQD